MDKILRYRIKELTLSLPMKFSNVSLSYIYHGCHMAKIFQFVLQTNTKLMATSINSLDFKKLALHERSSLRSRPGEAVCLDLPCLYKIFVGNFTSHLHHFNNFLSMYILMKV